MKTRTDMLKIHPNVIKAIQANQPVIAFESAVITHGLPHPINYELAIEMEEIAKNLNVQPATIALLNGKFHIGLDQEQISNLSRMENVKKISHRDIGSAIHKNWNGGTTVATTIILSNIAGINVFATGGIGGVHRGTIFDISADLQELANNSMIVVCAGAKSILDLSATLEYLESYGVPVLGYKTDHFPAFYARESELPVSATVDSAHEIANIYLNQKNLGLKNAVLVVNPVPENDAIPYDEMEEYIETSLSLAKEENISGSAITPYLLVKISTLSKGKTLKANLALLKNNAELASLISKEISILTSKKPRLI